MPKRTVESTFLISDCVSLEVFVPTFVSEHERPQANMLVEASGRLAA